MKLLFHHKYQFTIETKRKNLLKMKSFIHDVFISFRSRLSNCYGCETFGIYSNLMKLGFYYPLPSSINVSPLAVILYSR